MELQTVNIDKQKLIPSGASREGISVRRSGIAKVLWRKLNTEVPASKVIVGGVDIYIHSAWRQVYEKHTGREFSCHYHVGVGVFKCR